MNKSCLTITLFLLIGCNAENKKTPKITSTKTANNSVPVEITKKESISKPSGDEDQSLKINLGKQILISSGQFKSSEEITLSKSTFDAVIDGSDTIYLATSDPNFITPEKLKVGMKLSQIPAELKQNVQREPGWGYYILLKSQWNIGFCEGSACTDKDLTDNSTVKWIFKRK